MAVEKSMWRYLSWLWETRAALPRVACVQSEEQCNYSLPSLGDSLLSGSSAFTPAGFQWLVYMLDTCGLKPAPPSQGFRGAWVCRDFGEEEGALCAGGVGQVEQPCFHPFAFRGSQTEVCDVMALCVLQHIKYGQDKETCEVLAAVKEQCSLGNNTVKFTFY